VVIQNLVVGIERELELLEAEVGQVRSGTADCGLKTRRTQRNPLIRTLREIHAFVTELHIFLES
jgi:hypothetical protein